MMRAAAALLASLFLTTAGCFSVGSSEVLSNNAAAALPRFQSSLGRAMDDPPVTPPASGGAAPAASSGTAAVAGAGASAGGAVAGGSDECDVCTYVIENKEMQQPYLCRGLRTPAQQTTCVKVLLSLMWWMTNEVYCEYACLSPVSIELTPVAPSPPPPPFFILQRSCFLTIEPTQGSIMASSESSPELGSGCDPHRRTLSAPGSRRWTQEMRKLTAPNRRSIASLSELCGASTIYSRHPSGPITRHYSVTIHS